MSSLEADASPVGGSNGGEGDGGRVPPSDQTIVTLATHKLDYLIERIQMSPDWPSRWFDNDRCELFSQPGFHIFGKCPSCKHLMSGVCATEYLAQDTNAATAAAPQSDAVMSAEATFEPFERRERKRLKGGFWSSFTFMPSFNREATQVTVLQCACTYNHQPPASGTETFGCGSQWLLRVTYKRGKENRGKTSIDTVRAGQFPYYWPAADAAAAEIPNSLSDAQSSAKNWATGLAAAITLLGVSGLLGSGKTVQALSKNWQIFFGIFAFLSVLAAALMIYQSTFASYGSLRLKQMLEPSDLRNADLDPLIEARASMRRLRRSVWATGFSVLAALAAASILLFVQPPATAPTTTDITYPAKITYNSGSVTVTTACGTVQASKSPDNSLALIPNNLPGASPVTIELDKITAIASC